MPTVTSRRKSIDRSGRPKAAKPTNSSLSFLRILFPRLVQLREPIPRLLESPRPALDEEVYHFLALLVRDFIQTWYSSVSTDPEFISTVVNVVIHIARELERRCHEIDWVGLMLFDVPAVLKRHYTDYRQAAQKHGTVYAPNQTIESIFHGLQPHFALSDGQESEKEYLRQLSDELLRVLLPKEEYESDLVRWLVREILTCIVLKSLVELLTEPDMINYIINTLLSSFGPSDAAYEQLIREAREETTQQNVNYIASLAILRPKSSVRRKVVHKSATPNIDPTDDMVDMLQEAQSSILETPFAQPVSRTARQPAGNTQGSDEAPKFRRSSNASRQHAIATDRSWETGVAAVRTDPNAAQSRSPNNTLQYTPSAVAPAMPKPPMPPQSSFHPAQNAQSSSSKNSPQSNTVPPIKRTARSESLSSIAASLSAIIVTAITFLAAIPARVQQGLKTFTWIYTELDAPAHQNLDTGILDLANEIFFLQERNRVVWRQWEIMGWPLLRALGGDAIDRLLTRGIQWIFAEKQLIFYIQAGRKALWPDPKASSPPRPRGVHEMEEARREAEQRILRAIPAPLRDIFFGKDGVSHLAAAQDAMEPLQNKVCNKHLMYVAIDLLLSKVVPELYQ